MAAEADNPADTPVVVAVAAAAAVAVVAVAEVAAAATAAAAVAAAVAVAEVAAAAAEVEIEAAVLERLLQGWASMDIAVRGFWLYDHQPRSILYTKRRDS